MNPLDAARPTAAVVDLGACARNYVRILAHAGGRNVWAVVKADAYGHGAVPVARRLEAEGCFGFAVATVREGVELRQAGISRPILVTAGIEPLGVAGIESGDEPGADPSDPQMSRSGIVSVVAEHDLSVAIWDDRTAKVISRVIRQSGLRPISVHLKVDTGMGRLGVSPEQAPSSAATLSAMAGIELEGIFSNLAAADHSSEEAGHEHTTRQASRFSEVCAALQSDGCLPPQRHLANTAGIMHHPDSWEADWCNGVMPGIALYGVSLTPGRERLRLQPALSWWTAVSAIREIPAGWPVGYGLRYVAERPTRIAVLPVGYHDGWPRAFSDRAQVLMAGGRAPIVGAVSMDLTLVDVTELPATRVGDAVALIGGWGDCGMGVFLRDIMNCAADTSHSAAVQLAEPITAEDVATWADSIGHEILCRIGPRVPRLYLDSTASDSGGSDVSESDRALAGRGIHPAEPAP